MTRATERRIIYNEYPSVIIEVLSESTERIDRSEKFWNYTQIDSLQEYVVVAQERREVVVFRRERAWAPEVLRGPEEKIWLKSLNLELALAAIYDGVEIK